MAVYDILKDTIKLAQTLDSADLINKLLDAQKQSSEMVHQQQVLQSKVKDLQDELRLLKESKRPIAVKGHGWLVYEDDPEGPKFCSSCFSGESGRIHQLHKNGASGWYCSICKGMQK